MTSLTNKRVLITGAGGFIGSHLTEACLKSGARVKAMVHYNSRNDWGALEQADQETVRACEVFAGDVRDPHSVLHVTEGADVVFHLAALIGIPYSYHSPDAYVDTNVRGTLNILQAAREERCGRVLITSTSEVYGSARYVPIDEEHPRQGQSPYSATKIAADALAESFYRSFNLPVTIVRPFNAYGPRQSARAVIPTIIAQLLDGGSDIKLGSLNTTRDFNYVLDICRAFLMIAASDKLLEGEFNVASGKEISVGELAQMIIRIINPNAQIIVDSQRLRPSKSEVERLCGKSLKIRRATGWKPKHSLQKGLLETIEWFSHNMARYKGQIYNL